MNKTIMKNQQINQQATLYVGDLHSDVTETMLFETFKSYGSILSIRVIRDVFTSQSLRYAYVNFLSSQDAKYAMENMNFENIHGRPCRIMWSERDSNSTRSNVANIFIKNLHKSITTREIHDTFQHFGEIVSCKVEIDDRGVSKGFAFVNFKHECDALKAIETINGKSIRDKIVHVTKFIPQTQRLGRTETFTKCFIKNISTHSNETSLKELFQPFGEIVSVKIGEDENGVRDGLGFVDFKNHEDALKAVENLNGTNIEDEIVCVGRAINPDERQKKLRNQQTNLYVKHLNKNIDDERLKEMFSSFGKIISAKVMIDSSSNQSRGFGFINFSTESEASQAINEMNGKIVDGKTLYVNRAQSKEERRRHILI